MCRIVFIAVALLAAAGPAAADVIHVDDDAAPGGDGTSWATAYRFLRDGLEAAAQSPETPSTVRVAQGVYRPDQSAANPEGSGDRAATFSLATGVWLVGGNAGPGAPDPDRIDPAAYVTILTGDLNGNDGPGFAGYAENSYHVVTASGADETAKLFGFTITGGNADGAADPVCFGPDDFGTPCAADDDCGLEGHCVSPDSLGAGIYAVGGRPLIAHCRITGNFAAFQGGGILLKLGSHAAILDTVFDGNRALDNGGAMYLGHSSPLVLRCTFTGNAGGRYAGASCNRDHADAQFVDCLFEGNTAAEQDETGGGAIVNASSSPSFTGCVFRDNESLSGFGGAMYNKRGFDPDVGPSEPVLESCVFEGNAAFLAGGAVYNVEDSLATLAGCTLQDNTAEVGGAVFNTGDSTVILTGCGVLDNAAEYTGGLYSSSVGPYNYTQPGEPHFEVIGCTFAGNDSIWAPGGSAIFTQSGTGLVSDSTITGNTSDWGTGGVFCGNGYAGSGDLTVTGCVFSGNAGHDAGALGFAADLLTVTDTVFEDNYGWSGGGISVAAGEAAVSGCTFEGNFVNGPGGGIFLAAESVTVTDCDFIDNYAVRGGAVACENSAATITDCTMLGNAGGAYGGAVYNAGGAPQYVNCAIAGNVSGIFDGWGGGAANLGGAPEFINCTVAGNFAVDEGGGFYNADAQPVIANCIVWGNAHAGEAGEPAQIFDAGAGGTAIDHSCVEGWTGALGGAGNLGEPPMFVDMDGADGEIGTGDDDLRLQPGSPCIDAGDSAKVPAGITTDLDGNPRFADDPCADGAGEGVVDMGAWEFQGQSPSPRGDIDADCAVGITDMLELLMAWGPCPDAGPCPADLNQTGEVDLVDLLILFTLWSI